jgi:hypothetical protein
MRDPWIELHLQSSVDVPGINRHTYALIGQRLVCWLKLLVLSSCLLEH